MDKASYLKKLRWKLRRLPVQEIDAALAYYEEYFEEAGQENEQQVIKQLGSPSAVAAQIIADFALKDIDSTASSTKKNMTTLWLVILAILSAPLSLPLLATVFLLILTVGIVIFSIIFSIIAVIVSIFLGGIAAFIAGFLVLMEHWPTALLFMGLGLIVIGISILLYPFVARVIKKIGQVSVQIVSQLFHKITKKRQEEF
ncbi:DUF1700 domain-containing protein [Lysinibacillus piscis]|uniref:DUF1700 domain-containing protein n=1 Tax=Lysinibacillus piscis TaxID=2518931 RepID=A0ABQ5NF78_9BACI|nr:DUF1700 domain-containing protein [Lysinibacillus sp. KH24]GLC87042.1 hypothetical protein LYSBPC_01690 [Lysinibacillus sp. KH24]